jgi:hypothetical protein
MARWVVPVRFLKKDAPMSSTDLSQESAAALRVDPWHPWFAWHPVRLYMTGQFAWLRLVHRRTVTKPVGSSCEYTDDPAEFPDLAGKT